MESIQIASWLNNYVSKNEIVDPSTWTQLAEDMSNFGDVGTVISSLSGDTLKNLKGDFVAFVRNEYISRKLKEKTFGLIKAKDEYGATLQRIMAIGVFDALDSHINSLENGTDYGDFKFYGTSFDTKIFQTSDKWKIAFSISSNLWKSATESIDGVNQIIAIIEGKADNTYTNKINALSKRIFVKLIDNAITNSKKVHVITEFNRECNKDFDETSSTTIANTIIGYNEIMSDRDLTAMFEAWFFSFLDETCSYVGEFNKVYQGVENYTPKEKIRVILLDKIASKMKYLASPVTFREVSSPVNIETISGWQTTGKNIVKSLADVSTIKIDRGEDPSSQTTPKEHIIDTLSNVIGIIYDVDGVGATVENNTVSSQYVGSEDFTSYFMHNVTHYYIDDRFTGIALVLD